MLACRACRRVLGAADGCAVCTPIKANLVTTEEDSEQYPSLSDVGSETVGALQAILREHKRTVADRTAPAEDRLVAQSSVIKTANTLAKVLEAARKLQNDGVAAVRNMSFQERAALFAGWYQAQPPALRGRIRLGMEQFEETANEPRQLEDSNG